MTHTHTHVSAQPARGTTRILNGHGSGLDMLPFSQSLASKGYLCRRCSLAAPRQHSPECDGSLKRAKPSRWCVGALAGQCQKPCPGKVDSNPDTAKAEQPEKCRRSDAGS